MPYATDEDLTARVPGLAEVDPTIRATALEDAENEIDADSYEPLTLAAHVALTAHLIASRPDSGYTARPVGALTSKRIEALAVTYAAPHETRTGPHSTTSHGQEFDRLTAKVLHSPQAVGPADLPW